MLGGGGVDDRLLVGGEGQEGVPDEGDNVGGQDLELLRDIPEVDKLERKPNLPIGENNTLEILLQLGFNLLLFSVHDHQTRHKRSDKARREQSLVQS